MNVKILPSYENDPVARELSKGLGVEVLDLNGTDVIEDGTLVISCSPEENPYTLDPTMTLDIGEVAEIAAKHNTPGTMEAYVGVVRQIIGGWWQ